MTAALVFGALSPVGLAPATADDGVSVEPAPLSVPGMPVSLDQAGEVRVWGDDSIGQLPPPPELDGVAVTQLVMPMDSGLAVTADGRVVGWGVNPNQLERIPEAVAAAHIVQISATSVHALALTSDGHVLGWGRKRNFPTALDIPEGLSDVKQVVVAGLTGVALKNDGSVVTWGSTQFGLREVPEGLRATTLVAMGSGKVLALTPEGAMVTWGTLTFAGSWAVLGEGQAEETVELPATGIKAIAANDYTAMVILPDGLLAYNVTPPAAFSPPKPEAYRTKEPLLLANGLGYHEMAFVDRDRHIQYWDQQARPGAVPAELDGQDITQITLSVADGQTGDIPTHIRGGVLVRTLLRAELPQVAGTPAVGSTLTATPGTFSASPEAVEGQWLVDDVPLEGATGTTLTVTSAMAGKAITYRSTASKTGQATISSTSEPVTVPQAATVSVTAPTGAYGKASLVTVSVAGATGTVALTVGGKAAGSRTLSGGKAVFAVAAGTKPGRHALVATYAGSASHSPGSATGTLTVGKGRTRVPVVRVARVGARRIGTATVTIATAAGLVRAAGSAQLVLKKGRAVKKVNLRVVNGRATARVPRLPKGIWTAVVTYRGSAYYLPARSKAVRVSSR